MRWKERSSSTIHPGEQIIMDFNFKKIASDASGFFSRAKQVHCLT
uniref:PilZ domain-containing protein n=1 Tax=Ascaris lumbricoides TaxID=6252 RepID=A0A0M3IE27_ASCLU